MARGGLGAECAHRLSHLLKSPLAVGQIHRDDRLQILEFRAVAGQHDPTAQPAQPAQRLQVVAEAAVLIVDDGRATAEDGVCGQHRVVENETQRVGGVSRGRQHGDADPGGVDHLPVDQWSTPAAQEATTDRADGGARSCDDLVDAVGVVAVPMADQHQRNPAQAGQAVDVVVVIGARVDDHNLIAAGPA